MGLFGRQVHWGISKPYCYIDNLQEDTPKAVSAAIRACTMASRTFTQLILFVVLFIIYIILVLNNNIPSCLELIVSGSESGCQNGLFRFAEASLAVRWTAADGSYSGAWRFTERRLAVHTTYEKWFCNRCHHLDYDAKVICREVKTILLSKYSN